MAEKFMPSAEEVDRQIEDEFVDEVRDTISMLDVALQNFRSKNADDDEVIGAFRRAAHNLKLQGRSVDMPLIHLVTHQLDDYVADAKSLDARNIDDLQAFLDKLTAICDGDIPHVDTPEQSAKIMRELPSRAQLIAEFGDIEPKDVSVMMIVPEKAMGHIVEREMAACGYRTVNIRRPFEAIEMAVRTKPDMIIASMELGPISGVDLACAFAAMPKTRSLPFALLTSYSFGHPALQDLPPRAAILQKGKGFSEDVAAALARFGIT